MSETKSAPPPVLADERLVQTPGMRGALGATLEAVRSGELGALPVIIGLVIISTVFQILNPVFLGSENLVNLTLDCVPEGVIALGVVCVLLVGQIDLSVGSVSGLAAAIVGVLAVNHGWPVAIACLLACLTGCAIGWVYAQLLNRVGMPSFVSTLAGLLAFLGLQLYLLGSIGSINIPFGSALVSFAQQDFVPAALSYVLAALVAACTFAVGYRYAVRRRRAGLTFRSVSFLTARAVAVLVAAEAASGYLNRDRGVSWMFVFFIALVAMMNYALKRTGWGRSLYAVGGNAEAARRTGIKVDRVYTSAFVLCSLLAALGGILGAAQLASANQSSGTGDVNLDAIAAAVIGGTSLFGGRGSAYSALLGIVVIEAIASGLTLLNLTSSYRYMITGLVLAIAVAVDALARRSRASAGRA